MSPNGLMEHLYGPVNGRRGDGYLLKESKAIPELHAIHEELRIPFCFTEIAPIESAFTFNVHSSDHLREGY